MNRDQAIEAARQIGLDPGEEITLQSEYMIDNPHLHGRTDAIASRRPPGDGDVTL